ncbi:LysR family transcriptional regulator [Galenea microaerophila]
MSKRISQIARHATLRQLQVFEAIAHYHSFTKAAESLHLTQPTVSMQVKKLTEAIGIPIFEQIGRKVYLTEAGEILYEAVKGILTTLVEAEEQINRIKGVSGGQIKLSVVTTAQYFIPKVIHDFRVQYPEVNVAMQVGNKERLIQRIQRNKDDFYILGVPPEGLNVDSVRFAENPLGVVVNAQHPLAGQKGLRLADLVDEPFLMRETGSGIRAHIEMVFEQAGFVPNIKMVLGGNESIRLGLLQNLGISITSLPTLADEIKRGDLVVLDVEGFPIMRHWYLAYPKGKSLSIATERLIKLIKQEGAGLKYQDFIQAPFTSTASASDKG